MPTGIGLMGMGRVGRNLLRILHTNDDLRIVAVSDVVDPAALAYLVRFDSLLGRFPGEVRYHGDHLHMGDRKIKMHTEAKGPQTSRFRPGASWASMWSSRRPGSRGAAPTWSATSRRAPNG